MTDMSTGERLIVSTEGTAGRIIRPALSQVDEVCKRLDRARSLLGSTRWPISFDGEPEMAVINFGRYVDAAQIQAVLDETRLKARCRPCHSEIEIQALSDRIHADLREAHDYLRVSPKSRLASGTRRLAAQQAHAIDVRKHPIQERLCNRPIWPRLAVGYVSGGYLAESVFQHFVALFEDFVFEFLRLWLSAYPGGIPNKDQKPVKLAMVIDAPDRAHDPCRPSSTEN